MEIKMWRRILLDTQIRKLAAARHGYKSENSRSCLQISWSRDQSPQRPKASAVQPVEAPDELISWMESASRDSAKYHRLIDPFARAMFP